MSEHGSGTYSFDPESGVPASNEAPLPHTETTAQEARGSTSTSFNFELDVDIDQRQGGGGGGGDKKQRMSGPSLEERARYLSQPGEGWHRPATVAAPQPPPPPAHVPDTVPVSGQITPPTAPPPTSHPPPTTYYPPPPVTQAPPLPSSTAF